MHSNKQSLFRDKQVKRNMINKPICKMVLELTMTIGLLLLMAFELVGDQLHEWIGTGIFLLFILHQGLHWGMVCGGVRKILKSTPSRIRALLLRFCSVGIAFYGIKAMFQRELFSYLFYRTHFVMFNFEEPLIFFF